MKDKEVYILTDPLNPPSGECLKSELGLKFEWWNALCNYAHINHSPVEKVWKYYKDARQWLFRLLKGKDTILWMAFLPGTFRVTFYFPSRFEPKIENSDLPEEIKNTYRLTAGQKFRPVTILMSGQEDITSAIQLITLKMETLS